MKQIIIGIIGIIITVIVTFGAASYYQAEIVVGPDPVEQELKPIAQIDISDEIIIGKEFMVSGDLSYDPDGSIASWEWFVDNVSQGKREFLMYTFTDTDNHSIKLNIIDDDGLKSNIVKVVKANALDESNPRDPSSTVIAPKPQKIELKITSFGPTKYGSFNDSPFNKYKQNSVYFYLEDFEDGVLDTPGVSVKEGVVLFPDEDTDSVDIDDGLEDGFGDEGYSFWSGASGNQAIVFTFDKKQLGELPNYAGLVYTDAQYNSMRMVTFEAYGSDGIKIETIGPISMQTNQHGRTAGDRFFGVSSDEGIKGIKIEIAGGSMVWIEIDHLQYGYYNPSQ